MQNLLNWCKEYKLTNKIIWNDVVHKCMQAQGAIEEEWMMDDLEVRQEGMDQILIQLAY